MKWVNTDNKLPIKSWCENVEEGAMKQAENLANHPAVFKHVALMPDCHQGFGMPIGGVIACENAVIPNAVGVDIGCGMCAVKTSIPVSEISSKQKISSILETIKKRIPVGEGRHHFNYQNWNGFGSNLENKGWLGKHSQELARKSLGTLGGGNHFIEIQKGDDGFIWLMLHSGSRNLGFKIANHYHKLALEFNQKEGLEIPDKELAYLFPDSDAGQDYIRDMNFALNFAKENRARMINIFKSVFADYFKGVVFEKEINIHHNYVVKEAERPQRQEHFSKPDYPAQPERPAREIWVHRKGATSAKKGELGIIPGSMGTPSYIVEGLGNPESFCSCSHGAGRVMSRTRASQTLTKEECDEAMGNVVFDPWKKFRHKRHKGLLDFSESPQAYKNIESVIEAQLDLVKPIVKLEPLGVIKG